MFPSVTGATCVITNWIQAIAAKDQTELSNVKSHIKSSTSCTGIPD